MFNRILAPLDGSKLSECTLNYVTEVAAGCHVSKVVLITVLEPVSAPTDWWTNREQIEESSAEYQNKLAQMQENAENYLSKTAASFKAAGLDVDTVILKAIEANRVADTIIDYSETNNFDLIVISSHGRSGIARWAFGSVADKVVHHSKTPVMTIIPAGCRI
jgi:nucleotide-binding universal stress UspA family protein